RLVRENPYRLADDIHGIGFVTADSLRLMLGIAPTSTFRLHAALKYVLSIVARTEGHVYLPLADLADRTARQLDEQRATTGRWEADPELVTAIRTYVPEFAMTEDARLETGPSGDREADDAHIYSRELYDAECLAAERLAEGTRRDAYTIHRQLFSLDRQRQQLVSQSRGPVELFLPADAVIVDEASMVDLPLLAWLLRSVGPQTRLMFVGDKDQLASLGPGSVLLDLIASGRIPSPCSPSSNARMRARQSSPPPTPST